MMRRLSSLYAIVIFIISILGGKGGEGGGRSSMLRIYTGNVKGTLNSNPPGFRAAFDVPVTSDPFLSLMLLYILV